MKLSCLCATHDRRAFWPWIAWVYNQLDWDGPKELVLVDSTPGLGHVHPVSGLVPEEELVFVPSDEKGIAPKYQQALESASGEVVYWLDDDDYHVPDAALRCLPHLGDKAFVYPWVELFWLRLRERTVRRLDCYWWSAGLYRREALLAAPGFEGKSMCAEIRWAKRLQRLLPFAKPELGTVGFAISHAANISNHERRPVYRHRFGPVPDWSAALGLHPNHLAELFVQLRSLQNRVETQ